MEWLSVLFTHATVVVRFKCVCSLAAAGGPNSVTLVVTCDRDRDSRGAVTERDQKMSHFVTLQPTFQATGQHCIVTIMQVNKTTEPTLKTLLLLFTKHQSVLPALCVVVT